MTTLPGADIRSYYAALGIELLGWARVEAPVRCFGNPEAHHHEDRNPSCSVNLHTGAWNCHGCGAHGGAYDAALAKGHTPRSAIDLMVTHGLTERRPRDAAETGRATRSRRPAPASPLLVPAPRAIGAPRFTITERDIARWQQTLARRPMLIAALAEQRGWRYQTIRELELGLDQLAQRITIPIRDHAGRLQGLLRYQPLEPGHGPKTRAAPGTRLGLIPHPDALPDPELVLCEGPADMLAARSRGLPAIAIPSTSAWRADWASQLAGRTVAVVMDSDQAGRRAAVNVARDLIAAGIATHQIDLAPDRTDGYDLTDWLTDHHDRVSLPALRRAAPAVPSTSPTAEHRHPSIPPPPAAVPGPAMNRQISIRSLGRSL